jgi:hypothetical protein
MITMGRIAAGRRSDRFSSRQECRSYQAVPNIDRG